MDAVLVEQVELVELVMELGTEEEDCSLEMVVVDVVDCLEVDDVGVDYYVDWIVDLVAE